MNGNEIHGTTVITVRRDNLVAMGADGQVTQGNAIILKSNARKVRRIYNDQVLVGFAGATADAFALLEQFEGLLNKFQGNVRKSAIELAKKWRMDKALGRLDALITVADKDVSLLISGSGDVIEPADGILAIGSGGTYAYAAGKALYQHTKLNASEIVRESLLLAASICVYTNDSITMEEIRID